MYFTVSEGKIVPQNKALEEAFHHYTKEVHEGLDYKLSPWTDGFFTYLFTKKQKNILKRLCLKENWELPENYGITISGDFINHILEGRMGKDKVTMIECSKILSASFHSRSEVSINNGYEEQAVILNSFNKITVKNNTYYASAFFSVNKKLESKTAYHTGFNKIKRLLGDRKNSIGI